MNTSKLRLVRGGALAPEQVFGRESELAALTRMLETDSVLLLAERRTGKTSLLTLFEANAPAGWHVVKMSVESIASPEEFARRLRDTTADLIPPDALTRINSAMDRLQISQIGKVVRDSDKKPSTWQESIEVWRSELSKVEGQVVLILDELPYAIQTSPIVLVLSTREMCSTFFAKPVRAFPFDLYCADRLDFIT
jgi:AAA+ ATPase superfamily predicted ATPase